MIRVLDLFSCIGFHSIGLQRASPDFEIIALCEANERRRQELERLHPGVPIYDDVRTLPPIAADVVFGGPPCQATSVAAAIHGYRTGASLWPYMLSAGLNAGAEWFVVEQPPGNAAWEASVNRQLSYACRHVARFEFGAEDVGAPYQRRRVYLIACTSLQRLEIAWKAGPSAIERAKRAADARGDWDPAAIPAFDLDTWRSEDVHERKERIEALGDSNPPAMAEVIGYMIHDAMQATPSPQPNKRASEFPPSCCTAWEDCDHDGVCHDPQQCEAVGPNARGPQMEPCERCQGNGEIVTDWERYRHPHEGDVGDEAVTECPECNGAGEIEATPSPQPNVLGLSDAQVDAVLHLAESRLCIIWSKIGSREEFTNQLRVLESAPEEPAEICEACGEPFEDGDMVYWSADDTGHLHADCCGPERESYVGPDGAPLKDGEPIPEPFAYRDPRAATESQP